jgi:hypothetical protein
MKQYLAMCVITISVLAMFGIALTIEATESQKKSSIRAPAVIATADENVYVVWGGNNTSGNNTEIMFRASNDGGQTYKDKINLSNSSNSNSTDFDLEATANNVIVSWWETNSTNTEPVIIFSNDHGTTFGQILRLAANGTIG